MSAEIGAFREVLAEQTVGVLVGSTLPWCLGVAEVDVKVGGSVASLSADLGCETRRSNWRRQAQIDRGVEPGSTSEEQAEPVAARRETGHRTAENQGGVPKRRFAVIQTMRTEGLPIQVACRVLEVRVRFLCLALPTAVSPFHLPRCAYQHHPPTVTRYPMERCECSVPGALNQAPKKGPGDAQDSGPQGGGCVPTRV